MRPEMDITEIDQLAVGREFADFNSLSAAVALFEKKIHFVQLYKRIQYPQEYKKNIQFLYKIC